MRIAVGMSGGVDSSVAAALLKAQGHEVAGVTMKIWEGETGSGAVKRHGCYGPGDREEIADAAQVAAALGIPHHVIDLTGEYRHEVLDYFRDEYLCGRTPNPCVRCNQRIKFGMLLSKARESGLEFDRFATGHYARVEFDSVRERYLLKKARDLKKDQSYFLSALSQEQLQLALFPLGGYTKDEVRRLAGDFGLNVAQKPESQDFAEEGPLSLFTAPADPGPIKDRQGNVVGTHHGIMNYTVGQRKRLGVAAQKPLYVVEIDARANTVIVGGREEIYHAGLVASGVNWVSMPEQDGALALKVKIRYQHTEAYAMVTPVAGGRVRVDFREPQMAIAPGQTAAFYEGDTVVGGGTIECVRD